MLKPLTYPDPQSLVHLMNTGAQGSFPGANVPKFNIWRQQTGIFQQVAAYDTGGAGLNLTGNDQPEQVQGVHVSADYFSILGAPVTAGRTFTAAEDSPHGGNFVVLSYGLWKRRFGADRAIVDNTIQLNQQPYQVVGVIGREFVSQYPEKTAVFAPLKAPGFTVVAILVIAVGIASRRLVCLSAESIRLIILMARAFCAPEDLCTALDAGVSSLSLSRLQNSTGTIFPSVPIDTL